MFTCLEPDGRENHYALYSRVSSLTLCILEGQGSGELSFISRDPDKKARLARQHVRRILG